jgi:hypothetical protein
MRQFRGLVALAALAALIVGGWESPSARSSDLPAGGWQIRAPMPLDLYGGAAAQETETRLLGAGFASMLALWPRLAK